MQKFISYFWLFLIGSFIGFIIETLWCLLIHHKIEWRKSLIYEPLIPIYGLASIFIIIVGKLFQLKKDWQIFISGFFISTVIEYLASFFQEKIFGTISWDYRNLPLNISGRVNFIYSFLFGLTTLIFYNKFLLPVAHFFFSLSLTKPLIILFLLTLFAFILDVIISAVASLRMQERRHNIFRNGPFWHYIDNKYNDEFLKKIYPNAIIINKEGDYKGCNI